MIRSPASRHPLFWGAVLALCAAFGGQSLASVPAAAAPTSPVSGYRYVQQDSAFNSASARSVSARCPRGKVVLAGGAYIVGGGQRVLLRGSYPVHSFSGDWWTASAEEFAAGGTSAGWQVRSYAVCANRPAGLTYGAVSSASDSSSPKSVRQNCPVGTQIIGVGARVIGADYRVGLNAITITSDHSTSARASEATATRQKWSVVSHAVCARPLGQVFRETGHWVNTGSTPPPTATANCPQGSLAFGAGLRFRANLAGLNRLVPLEVRPTQPLSPAPARARATVSELAQGIPGTLQFRAQVICAR